MTTFNQTFNILADAVEENVSVTPTAIGLTVPAAGTVTLTQDAASRIAVDGSGGITFTGAADQDINLTTSGDGGVIIGNHALDGTTYSIVDVPGDTSTVDTSITTTSAMGWILCIVGTGNGTTGTNASCVIVATKTGAFVQSTLMSSAGDNGEQFVIADTGSILTIALDTSVPAYSPTPTVISGVGH